MYTLGHNFMPPDIHAGGLRYHGASALLRQMYHGNMTSYGRYLKGELTDFDYPEEAIKASLMDLPSFAKI